MRTFGILGHPVGHSKSPAMQAAALQAAGIDAQYVPFDVRPEDLAQALSGLRLLPVAGLNVTVPHKEAILPLLDDVSDEARRIGAVNTIVVRGAHWRGENTDAPALARILPRVGPIVVLGAGGAARAVLAAIAGRGTCRVVIANRTLARAEMLARDARGWGLDASAAPLDRPALESALADALLLVQASSAGMRGGDTGGLDGIVPIEALPDSAAVVDLVYDPRPTDLCRRARARGLVAQDGIEMLLEQGALSFALWTSIDAPRQAMREAIERGLR